jgi:AsmA protein
MSLKRLRWSALIIAAVLFIPPLIWVGLVTLAPTDWAKRHVEALVAARTGRSVRLDRISARLFGGIRLTKLEIGSPQSADDPWLNAADVRFDIDLFALLRGKVRTESVHVDGVNLRVLRRADGTFELADLIKPATAPTGEFKPHTSPKRVVIHIRGGTLTVVDEPSRTRLHMRNVECEAVREDQKTVIEKMRGVLNGGPFQFVGELDRTQREPSVVARFQAEDVVLDDGMSALRYAVPVLAGASLHLKGHLNSDLYVQGQGSNWDALSRSLVGHGVIAINPIDLHGAPLVAELSKIAEFSRQGGIASIRSDFAIKDSRITTDNFTLKIGRTPITMSGWTGFDGQLDYRINLAGLSDRIPERARRVLGELNVEFERLTNLTLRGTVNRMVVQLNGVPLDKGLLRESGIKREDREKLRVLGRRLLDELVR